MIWLIRRLTLIFCVCCIYSYIIVLWFGFLTYMSLVLPLFLSIDVICCGFSACFLVCLFYCIVVWFGTYVIVQTRVSVLPLNSKYRQAAFLYLERWTLSSVNWTCFSSSSIFWEKIEIKVSTMYCDNHMAFKFNHIGNTLKLIRLTNPILLMYAWDL